MVVVASSLLDMIIVWLAWVYLMITVKRLISLLRACLLQSSLKPQKSLMEGISQTTLLQVSLSLLTDLWGLVIREALTLIQKLLLTTGVSKWGTLLSVKTKLLLALMRLMEALSFRRMSMANLSVLLPRSILWLLQLRRENLVVLLLLMQPMRWQLRWLVMKGSFPI